MKIKGVDSKKGQATIFVIVGILIVLAVAIFFLVRLEVIPDLRRQQEVNPHNFLISCLEEEVKDAIEIISIQGGYVENKLNRTFQFQTELDKGIPPIDRAYLCYNQNNYLPCVNQEPMLISHLKQEIKNEISESVRSCFDGLVSSLESRAYVVDKTYNDFEVLLSSNVVSIDIDGVLVLTKTDETRRIDGLKFDFPSRFYDLSIVVQEIVSQEARFCNFEHLGYMLVNPEFKINKFRTGDSTTIYKVAHRESKEEFVFAVRSCVIPPGF